MSDRAIVAAVTFLAGIVITGTVQAAISSWTKRQDEQRKETGKRIGRLERRADIELGRRLGAAEERKREARKGKDNER